MNGEHKHPSIEKPVHLFRCAWELGVLALRELAYHMDNAIDAAWPEDDDLDAAIPSTISEHRAA